MGIRCIEGAFSVEFLTRSQFRLMSKDLTSHDILSRRPIPDKVLATLKSVNERYIV